MRLVDADALKAKAFGKRGGLIHTSDIDAMPTVEAVPVVHGRWTNPADDGAYGVLVRSEACDQCKNFAVQSISYPSEGVRIELYNLFCPNCGAKMDGKDGDHEKAD